MNLIVLAIVAYVGIVAICGAVLWRLAVADADKYGPPPVPELIGLAIFWPIGFPTALLFRRWLG